MIHEEALKFIDGAQLILNEEKNGNYLLHDAEMDNFIWDSDGGLTIRLWVEGEIVTLHFPDHVFVSMDNSEFWCGNVSPNSVVSNMEAYVEDGPFPLVVELQTVGITVKAGGLSIERSEE
jgi:hypothetical protein